MGEQVVRTDGCFYQTGEQVVRTVGHFYRTGDQAIRTYANFFGRMTQVVRTNASFRMKGHNLQFHSVIRTSVNCAETGRQWKFH